MIDGKVSPASVYAADGAPAASAGYGGSSAPTSSYGASASSGSTYTVDFGDNDQRALTLDQLVDAYNTGEVVAETYVWTEGMAPFFRIVAILCN